MYNSNKLEKYIAVKEHSKMISVFINTFYFITSNENNDRIMTLTLILTTSHLTADRDSSFFSGTLYITAFDRSVNGFHAHLFF